MKYQWTDWITHVPGQEMPVGTYGIWEQLDKHGRVTQTEAAISTAQVGHPTWRMANPFGEAKQLTRFKLRSIAAEHEDEVERKLEFVE